MSNINFLNSQIEQYQKMWILANQRGDQQAMAQAHQQAEALRQQGGTLRADQDTAATRALKQAVQTAGVHVTIQNYSVQQLNQGIVQAKQDYQYAQARGDRNAMQAASSLANNYRALGGTISASASLVDAQNQLRSSTTNSINNQKTSNMVSLFYAHPAPDYFEKALPQRDGSIVGMDNNGNRTVYVSPTNPNINLQNGLVENDKLNYINAQVRGDQQNMNKASSDASYRRDLGATLGAGEETSATSALKNYYSNDPIVVAAVNRRSTDALNKAIWKAKNDYTYAQQHNDEAGMKAAEALGANMRAMGGTIGADVSLQQAHDMVFGTQYTQNRTNSTSGPVKTTDVNANLTYVSGDHRLDRTTLTAVLTQYLKSKVPGYLPDDIRGKAAAQDFNMMYAGLSDDALASKIKSIVDSEKLAQHFQQEIQSGNYDQNALMHEPGYSQYAMNQAYQQDPFGGMNGILLGMGLMKAFDGRNGGGEVGQSKAGGVLSLGKLTQDELKSIGSPAENSGIRAVKGNASDAFSFFKNQVDSSTIKEVQPGVYVGNNAEGITFTFRADSKSGPPTIDVNGVQGVRKIKFIN